MNNKASYYRDTNIKLLFEYEMLFFDQEGLNFSYTLFGILFSPLLMISNLLFSKELYVSDG